MKILFIHNHYIQYGGEDAVFESQIQLLKQKGHQIIKYTRKSVEIKSMPLGKIRAFFCALYNPRSVKEVKNLLAGEKPDVVHVHNLFPLISPAILPVVKKAKIPIVMTVHNYRLLCPNGLFYTHGEVCEACLGPRKEWNCVTNNCEDSRFKSVGYAIRNWWARKKQYYLKNIDAFACLTNFQKEKLINNGFPKKRIFIIPNMHRGKLDIRNSKIKTDLAKYVAIVGRISPEKGIDLLIKTAKLLPEVSFKLAGGIKPGYVLPELPNNVKLVGSLNKDQLNDFYEKSYLFVLSSTCYEGFPMVFPEAMNYSLPIIAPNMAGFPEVVEHEVNGLLFEPGNAKDLARQISVLYESPKKAKEYGEKGFLKFKKKYTSEVYYQKLMTLHRVILLKNRAKT